MIDNQETQEKIAAEVRDLSKCIKHKMEMGDYIFVPMPTAFGKPLDVYYAELADRIEAAWKREREELEGYAKSKMLDGATIIDNRTVGDAAAMREALKGIVDVIDVCATNDSIRITS